MTTGNTAEDLGWTPAMLDFAAHWPVEPAAFHWRGPKMQPDGTMAIEDQQSEGYRCTECGCRIFDDTPSHKAQHLVMYHGYRMDGRHESDQT